MKDATIAIRINEQEKEQLREAAEKLDVTMSQLLRQMIKEKLKEIRDNGNCS